MSWQERGACTDDVHFTDKEARYTVPICCGCPVKFECLDETLRIERELQNPQIVRGHPVYGGMTGRERFRLLQLERLARLEAEASVAAERRLTDPFPVAS